MAKDVDGLVETDTPTFNALPPPCGRAETLQLRFKFTFSYETKRKGYQPHVY